MGFPTSTMSLGIGEHSFRESSLTTISAQKPIDATCRLWLSCTARRSSTSPSLMGTPSYEANVPLAIGPGSCRIGLIVL